MVDQKLKQIEKKIQGIKQELMNLGELRPGSLSKQYNICGTEGCKCKDAKNPKKHGPYYQLSYVRRGRSTSAFVRQENVTEVKKQLVSYKKLKQLVKRWILLSLEHCELKAKKQLKATRSKK